MSRARRFLVGLALTICLGIVGLVCGGLLVPVFVTAPGFDGLADALGFIFGGTLIGSVSGMLLAVVLSPSRLIAAFRTALVAAGISIAVVAYLHFDGQNGPTDSAMEVPPPTKPTAPTMTSPADTGE